MSSIAFFSLSLVLFLVISAMGYFHIKKTMEKQLGMVSDRLKRLEKEYDILHDEKAKLEGEAAGLRAEIDRLRKRDHEKARLVRQLRPGNQRMTVISALEELGHVVQGDLDRAREWILDSGTDMSMEQVLVERGAITGKQFDEARRMSDLFNSIIE